MRVKTTVSVLMAGIFCACAATLISTLWVVLFLVVPAHAVQGFKGFLSAAFSILFFALVPAGLFGFVCGVISRLYLLVRSAHIATTVGLVSECGIIGVLFSFVLLFVSPAPCVGTRRVDQFEGNIVLRQCGLSRVYPVRDCRSKGFASSKLILSSTNRLGLRMDPIPGVGWRSGTCPISWRQATRLLP